MKIGQRVGIWLLHCAVAAVLALSVNQARSAEPAAKKARILMVTASRGFAHDVVKRGKEQLAPAEVAVTQLGQQSGLFTVVCSQDPVADLTPENLKNYDIVWFYTTGDLGIPKENIEYFLGTWLKQKGHGFIGTHSASDTYKDYEPYWDMVGGTFVEHPWQAAGTVAMSVHDTQHPASRPFGPEFEIKDEIYRYIHWQPEKVHVLMSINMAKSRVKRPMHVPVAWVKEYGQGRVFYTNLGHNPETWANKQFLDSLTGGVRWIMGLEPGDATPNPDVSKAEEAKAKSDAGN